MVVKVTHDVTHSLPYEGSALPLELLDHIKTHSNGSFRLSPHSRSSQGRVECVLIWCEPLWTGLRNLYLLLVAPAQLSAGGSRTLTLLLCGLTLPRFPGVMTSRGS